MSVYDEFDDMDSTQDTEVEEGAPVIDATDPDSILEAMMDLEIENGIDSVGESTEESDDLDLSDFDD